MANNTSRRMWLPYLVGGIGCFLSFLLWYSIRQEQHYFGTHPTPETYHPLLALLFGLSFSILIAVIVRTAQTAHQQALRLKQINEDLKKEITERINAEETKQKLEVALLQGQKLQAIGTLAGGIAHDFNNILYAIIGYIELSQDDVEQDSVVYKNLGKVLDAAHRGQDLISRILAFSRRQHHRFEVINLEKTLEAALELLKSTIPASVIIEFEKAEDMFILGNQTQIHQVLVNIINNSVDAMDGEGTITVRMSRIAKNDPFLRQVPEAGKRNYCKVEITDTGHGMDQSVIERMYEPFFTTKEVGKGTGLGLSIVHTIIKEHEGEIIVKSQLGHGSTFTILLPEYSQEKGSA